MSFRSESLRVFRRGRVLSAAGVLTILACSRAFAVSVGSDEMAEARAWAAAKFKGVVEREPVGPGLTVLTNHGPVQKNARGDRPLRIADTLYVRGLYVHAVSKVAVRLPGPGQTFIAIVGVDTNEQTVGGRGSVVFSVNAGGRELFRSPVLREGVPGTPVTVELGGATEFVLEIGDAGDGITCDQADWCEAKVTLADGRAIWLGDLPLHHATRKPYGTDPPFSFTFGGRSSRELLRTWRADRTVRPLDPVRTEHTLAYADPVTGLVVRCVGVEWRDFPVVEWTLHFKNTGASDSPILEDIQAIDTVFERDPAIEFVLNHHKGDDCSPSSFAPIRTTLEPKSHLRFAPSGGRPSSGQWPYYNIETPGEGVILAIGWPGQWASQFVRDEATGLRVLAGQERTRLKLHPGEEVRQPLIALLFYQGQRVRGQNLWRQWMFAHNFPKDHGKPLAPKLAGCSGWHFPNLMCNQQGEIEFIDRYLAEGIRLDYWWMDAGWYPCDGVGWPKVGTWEPDKKRYPGGIRAVADHAHAKGIQTVLWFEPERVHAGTWLTENHPEWILGGKGGGLLNLDDPNARTWVTDHIDRIITEQGVDLYRQDFNIDPLDYWRRNDPPDRQGLTEIRHIEGYLAYWDELRRRHPGMLIDSCASGGRRNDLETMRRAVPLLRTDCEFHATGNQCHTYGFDPWLPFHECGNRDIDPYSFRSNMSPMMAFVWDVRRKDLNYDLARRLIGQWRQVADFYFGDFYPLTPYSTAEDAWMAWQFDRPDLGGGMVQAFRRPQSVYEAARVRLQGLNPDARYEVVNFDAPGSTESTGQELMTKGLLLTIPDQPGAVVIVYQAKKSPP